jgi:integrase
MPVNLTDTAIKAAKVRAVETKARVELVDAREAGLRLRMTPAGAQSWVLACRDPMGAMRRFPLGDYPAMGISQAREAAQTMRVDVRRGADPIAEARRKRAIGREARAGIGTLTALLDLYASKNGGSLKSWPECRRRIDSVFKAHLAKPLATMKLGDLQMTAEAHKAQQSAAAAVRYLRPVLRWASAPGRGYVSADLTRIVPPATVRRRDRVLSRDELARLLPVLRQSDRPYAAAMLFMLLTLARREEVGAARWRTVDLKGATWTIAETKNGQPHVVPLSRQAVDLLRSLRPEEPEVDALVFATGTGRTLGNWDREAKALQEASETTDWTRHDLRRTGATMLGEMGELPDIIEAALNHVSIRSTVAATYNRSRYRPQVAAALQRLGDALEAIADGGGNVVRLDDARAVRPGLATSA